MPGNDSSSLAKGSRRTIVYEHLGATKPWALVVGGREVLAQYETEQEARAHDARMRANEQRDLEAIRAKLPEWERRYAIASAVVTETPDIRLDYRADVELREAAEGPQLAMWIPFNSTSEELWGFREVIRPGAFTKTARESDIVALWNHDPTWVLGRRSNKTLSIGLSDDGAEAIAQLDGDDAMHRHFARRVERRDVVGASFGFSVVKDRWSTDEEHENIPLRELLEVKLRDISPVAFPAYPESETTTRSLVEVVTARTGAPVDDLLRTLADLRDGHVPAEHAAMVREWAVRLASYSPAPDEQHLLAIRKQKAAFRLKIFAA